MALNLLKFISVTSVLVSFVRGQDCLSASEQGFASCGQNTGSPNAPFQQLVVVSGIDCVRKCASNSLCTAVVVSVSEASLKELVCELYSGPPGCDRTEYREGFQYYRRLELGRRCLEKSPEIKAAVRVNDTYILFYSDMVQTFRLDRDGLYATACPVRHTDYWWVWPKYSHLNAAVCSDIFNNKLRMFLIFGTSVHHGFIESRLVTDRIEDISSFFGPNLPGDIRAIASEGETFYVFTQNGVYARSPVWNVTDIPIGPKYKFTNTEFGWTDITAAALTSNSDVMMVFVGNRYFLFDMVLDVLLDSGHVCTNVYSLKEEVETLGLPLKKPYSFGGHRG